MNKKQRDKLASELFSEYGKKGSAVRNARLTDEQKSEIGRKGAAAMWKNNPDRRKK